ncbi:MAG: hypothetical protein ACRDEA_03830 [Microcystaceae cyanobacterium]
MDIIRMDMRPTMFGKTQFYLNDKKKTENSPIITGHVKIPIGLLQFLLEYQILQPDFAGFPTLDFYIYLWENTRGSWKQGDFSGKVRPSYKHLDPELAAWLRALADQGFKKY